MIEKDFYESPGLCLEEYVLPLCLCQASAANEGYEEGGDDLIIF